MATAESELMTYSQYAYTSVNDIPTAVKQPFFSIGNKRLNCRVSRKHQQQFLAKLVMNHSFTAIFVQKAIADRQFVSYEKHFGNFRFNTSQSVSNLHFTVRKTLSFDTKMARHNFNKNAIEQKYTKVIKGR